MRLVQTNQWQDLTRKIDEGQVGHVGRRKVQANHVARERELLDRLRWFLALLQRLGIERLEYVLGNAGVKNCELCAPYHLFQLRLVVQEWSKLLFFGWDLPAVLVGFASQQNLALPGTGTVRQPTFHGASKVANVEWLCSSIIARRKRYRVHVPLARGRVI